MKLSKIAALCRKNKFVTLYDDSTGNVQWISCGGAMYPAHGFPYLTADNVLPVFDVSDADREKWHVTVDRLSNAPVSAEETAPGEYEANLFPSIQLDGHLLKPIGTTEGIIFIDTKFLDPLPDHGEDCKIYIRENRDGGRYVVAKTGFLIDAIIAPFHIEMTRFIDVAQSLIGKCEDELAYQLTRAARESGTEHEQTLIDLETGEIKEEKAS